MRLGVSVKIFLAYAVLLTAFAATTIFTLVYLHRARAQVVANQQFFEVQSRVDAAWRSLGEFTKNRPPRNDLRDVLSFDGSVKALGEAIESIDEYARREGASSRQLEFEGYRSRLSGLARDLVELKSALGTFLATTLGTAPDSDAGHKFLKDLTTLQAGLNSVRRSLAAKSAQITTLLADEEERAVEAALVLGAIGLLAAVGAALFILRTLRPLGVLRENARRIAGGDYGRAIALDSRDEIGDLAREFDGMARAIQEREHRLIRSEQLATVGRMSAQITHEIRNPLASIALYVELLGDELGVQSEEGKRLAASIGAEVDRLSEITESYLRFVRLPKPKLDREDLGEIVANVMEFSRAELALAGVSLELAIAPGVSPVAADESQLRQVLLNLSRNAREAMVTGGKLRVSVWAPDAEHVRLSIADTGPGIAPANMTQIFDPFFSTKDRGTGLGLALVQQIVGEHGGRLDVEQPEAGGTVFVITLPVFGGAGLPAALTAGSSAAEPREVDPPPAVAAPRPVVS